MPWMSEKHPEVYSSISRYHCAFPEEAALMATDKELAGKVGLVTGASRASPEPRWKPRPRCATSASGGSRAAGARWTSAAGWRRRRRSGARGASSTTTTTGGCSARCRTGRGSSFRARRSCRPGRVPLHRGRVGLRAVPGPPNRVPVRLPRRPGLPVRAHGRPRGADATRPRRPSLRHPNPYPPFQ